MVGFLGGLAQNYNSNFISNIKEGEETYVVVEADEFDRSFLTLHPYIAAVTNVDADHLDIYGTADSVIGAFNDFVAQIKPDGQLFVCSHIHELKRQKRVNLRFRNSRPSSTQYSLCGWMCGV